MYMYIWCHMSYFAWPRDTLSYRGQTLKSQKYHKTRASVLFLGFQYLQLQNIYKRITNSVVSSFIDSGVGLVLSMVCFSPSIEQQKQVCNCETNNVGVVHNEWTNHLCLQALVNKSLTW